MAIFLSHKVLKIVNLLSPDVFFQPQNTPKFVFGRGSAPDPAVGAYDAPRDPLVGWGGRHPLPIDVFGISRLDPRRLRRLAARRLQRLDPG